MMAKKALKFEIHYDDGSVAEVEHGLLLQMSDFDENGKATLVSEAAGMTVVKTLAVDKSPFAYHRVEAIDLTETFKDAEYLPNIQQIDAATQAAMGGRKEPRASFTTKAVPDDLQDLYLTDTLIVVYPKIKFNQRAKIVGTVFHPIIEKYTEMTIGEIRTSIIDTIAALQKG